MLMFYSNSDPISYKLIINQKTSQLLNNGLSNLNLKTHKEHDKICLIYYLLL